MSLIKTSTINFNDLDFSKDLSLNLTSSVVKELEENFTDDEQRWYVAQLYMYLNYHPTEDFPLDLENIYKIIGFANKGNAKRTLENNFNKEEDYKITILPREKKQNVGRSVKYIISMDTLKTCAQGALGAMTFGAYHMYVTTEMIKQNNKYFEKQFNEMKEENKELKEQINKRWFF